MTSPRKCAPTGRDGSEKATRPGAPGSRPRLDVNRALGGILALTFNTKHDEVTTMRESTTFTVSLPPAMAEQVERARKAENRTRSELVREALRVYLSAKVAPVELPTAAEARAYRRGIAAYKRDNYVNLGRTSMEWTVVLARPAKKALDRIPKAGRNASSKIRNASPRIFAPAFQLVLTPSPTPPILAKELSLCQGRERYDRDSIRD